MNVDRLLYRPVETAEAIGVSRSRVYELIANGDIPSIKVGGVTRVPVDSLRDWVARKLSKTRQSV